jgi:hypothetical protein
MTGSRTRHRRCGAAAALAAAAGLLIAALAPGAILAADPVEITFVSDASWTVTDADASVGPSLSLPGAAQAVCLNASSPGSCPAGATLYGWPGAGWGADLAPIAGAYWVWAPGIDAASSPANDDTYYFTREVTIPGTPVTGTFWVAADDGAQVLVNGTAAGTSGDQSSLTQLDISTLLVSGANSIVVRGTNGTICPSDCPYASNPAGVVFGGTITYTPLPTPEPSAPAADATAAPAATPPPTSTSGAAPAPDAGLPVLVLLALVAGLSALVAVRRPARRTR